MDGKLSSPLVFLSQSLEQTLLRRDFLISHFIPTFAAVTNEKPRMMRISYLILILFSLELKPLYATWQRPVTNYTRYDYEAGTQNWMLEQLDNGWIYVANNKGLLEFDGVTNLYPIQYAKMKAVKKEATVWFMSVESRNSAISFPTSWEGCAIPAL